MSETERLIERVDALIVELQAGAVREKWPKSVAEYAAYLARDVRCVQQWIASRQLRVNRKLRPAMITASASALFLEGNPLK